MEERERSRNLSEIGRIERRGKMSAVCGIAGARRKENSAIGRLTVLRQQGVETEEAGKGSKQGRYLAQRELADENSRRVKQCFTGHFP